MTEANLLDQILNMIQRVAEIAPEYQRLRKENELLKRNVITVHVMPQPCLACKGTGQVFDAADEEYMDCGTCHGTKTAPTPAPVILRDEVALFAVLMEARLRANDAEKGAQGWKNMPWRRLLSILRDQTNELAAHLLDDAALEGRAEGVMREAADVANLAMMLADTQGDLFHNVGGGVMSEERMTCENCVYGTEYGGLKLRCDVPLSKYLLVGRDFHCECWSPRAVGPLPLVSDPSVPPGEIHAVQEVAKYEKVLFASISSDVPERIGLSEDKPDRYLCATTECRVCGWREVSVYPESCLVEDNQECGYCGAMAAEPIKYHGP